MEMVAYNMYTISLNRDGVGMEQILPFFDISYPDVKGMVIFSHFVVLYHFLTH